MSAARVGVAYAVSSGYTAYLRKSLGTVPSHVPVTVCWAGKDAPPALEAVHPAVTVVRPKHERTTFSRAYYLNVAARNCQAEHVVLADADMLFPSGYFDLLGEQAQQGRVVRCWIGYISQGVTQAILSGAVDWSAFYVDYPGASFAEMKPRKWTERALRRLVWMIGRASLGPALRVEYREGRQFDVICGMVNPCCYSMEDLSRIRGYDERFSGWGCEDDELTARSRALGVTDTRMAVIVGHLWHGEMAALEYPDYYERRRRGEGWPADPAWPWKVNNEGWGDGPA